MFWSFLAVSDNSRPFLAILGQFGAIFVPELKFVADQSCDHSKRSQEGWNFDGYGFWSHFEPVEITLGNFGVILVPFQVHFGPICGPELKLSPTSHVTTENDRKGSRFLMKMVSEVTLMTLRPFQALFYNFGVILGSFGAILGPKMTWTSWSWVLKPSSSAFCSSCGLFQWSHD